MAFREDFRNNLKADLMRQTCDIVRTVPKVDFKCPRCGRRFRDCPKGQNTRVEPRCPKCACVVGMGNAIRRFDRTKSVLKWSTSPLWGIALLVAYLSKKGAFATAATTKFGFGTAWRGVSGITRLASWLTGLALGLGVFPVYAPLAGARRVAAWLRGKRNSKPEIYCVKCGKLFVLKRFSLKDASYDLECGRCGEVTHVDVRGGAAVVANDRPQPQEVSAPVSELRTAPARPTRRYENLVREMAPCYSMGSPSSKFQLGDFVKLNAEGLDRHEHFGLEDVIGHVETVSPSSVLVEWNGDVYEVFESDLRLIELDEAESLEQASIFIDRDAVLTSPGRPSLDVRITGASFDENGEIAFQTSSGTAGQPHDQEDADFLRLV